MRKIKFRAKYFGDGKTWVYGDLIHKRTDKDCVIIQDDNGCGSDCSSETACQYSGYNSVDDKEIYEGDIIEQDETCRTRFVVVFDDGAFRIATDEQKACLDRHEHPYFEDYRELPSLNSALMSAPFRVIGNIFDNQDLL